MSRIKDTLEPVEPEDMPEVAAAVSRNRLFVNLLEKVTNRNSREKNFDTSSSGDFSH